MSCCLKPVTPKIHWDFKPQISSIHIDIFEAPFSNQLLRLGAAEALRQAVAYSRKQSMKRQEAREVKRKKLVILPRSWQNSFMLPSDGNLLEVFICLGFTFMNPNINFHIHEIGRIQALVPFSPGDTEKPTGKKDVRLAPSVCCLSRPSVHPPMNSWTTTNSQR